MEDRIEFENDAPLELVDSDSFEKTSGIDAVEKVFSDKTAKTKERNAKIKEKSPALNLRVRNPKLQEQKPKDYIMVHCNLCEHDFQHAKKDDNGAFMPYAICQHIVFLGVVVEK